MSTSNRRAAAWPLKLTAKDWVRIKIVSKGKDKKTHPNKKEKKKKKGS